MSGGISLVAQTVKNSPAMQEPRVRSLSQEDPVEKRMATGSSICLGNPMDRNPLAGYSPGGRKESDTT